MMHPTYPRILPDRDKENDWYLDEEVSFTLHNGNRVIVEKGFKFDSHSVPWWAQWKFPKYIPTDKNIGNDIYCALVHDSLIAAEHWLPYSKQFKDYEYWRFMQMPEYKMTKARAKWMPRAVKTWANLVYRNDYRGEVENGVHITYIIVGAKKVIVV